MLDDFSRNRLPKPRRGSVDRVTLGHSPSIAVLKQTPRIVPTGELIVVWLDPYIAHEHIGAVVTIVDGQRDGERASLFGK